MSDNRTDLIQAIAKVFPYPEFQSSAINICRAMGMTESEFDETRARCYQNTSQALYELVEAIRRHDPQCERVPAGVTLGINGYARKMSDHAYEAAAGNKVQS